MYYSLMTLKLELQDIPSIVKQLAEGYVDALTIFFLTLLISLPLGLIVAFGRMSKHKIISLPVKFYISIMRGTPLMLQLIGVYFGPALIIQFLGRVFENPSLEYFAMPSNYRFTAVIIAFGINYAAYFAEIYRGGIEAVPKGQYEAGEILGFSKSQIFFKIVFPQMVKNILPAATNEIITLVKDTSLAFAISYVEMFTIAKMLVNSTSSLIPLIISGAFYYVTNLVVAFVMGKVEKRMNYFN